MNDYDQALQRLQADAAEELQKILANPKSAPVSLRAERTLFLVGIVKARLRKKLTQSELAAKSGMQQSTISRIENGKGNPSFHTLLTIAKALETNLVLEYKE